MDEEVENTEIVITNLNGLPGSMDSLIQGMCANKEVITFKRLWEEHTQEEDRLIIRENNMGATEDQDFMIQRRYLKR